MPESSAVNSGAHLLSSLLQLISSVRGATIRHDCRRPNLYNRRRAAMTCTVLPRPMSSANTARLRRSRVATPVRWNEYSWSCTSRGSSNGSTGERGRSCSRSRSGRKLNEKRNVAPSANRRATAASFCTSHDTAAASLRSSEERTEISSESWEIRSSSTAALLSSDNNAWIGVASLPSTTIRLSDVAITDSPLRPDSSHSRIDASLHTKPWVVHCTHGLQMHTAPSISAHIESTSFAASSGSSSLQVDFRPSRPVTSSSDN